MTRIDIQPRDLASAGGRAGSSLLALLLSPVAFGATLTVNELAEGDLVVSEVMVDPVAADDARGEWFEITNNSGSDVDLDGLILSDNDTDSEIVSGTVLVAAGDSAIFAVRSSSGLNGGLPSVDYVYDRKTLRFDNTDELNLSNSTGTIDSVTWGAARGLPVSPGASLNLDTDYYDATLNDSYAYWCDGSTPYGAGDLGTPGDVNDDCGVTLLGVTDLVRGDLVITEVMPDSLAVDDYYGEWFELVNATGQDVNLRGLILTDAGTDTHTVASDVVIGAGDTALFATRANSGTNGGLPTPDYIYSRAQLKMDNGADELILGNGSLTIDEVAWTKTGLKATAGYALSLDPSSTDADANDSADAWCDGQSVYGAGDFGTPDAANDACPADADGDGYDALVDCDDADAAINPAASELCDGLDNDCDLDIDEDATDATTWYLDHDADGFGTDFFSITDCDNPLAVVFVDNMEDCDDLDGASFPGADETCDGADNDCDDEIDEDAVDPGTFYADADSDGYGDVASTAATCSAETGYVANDEDCDDTNSAVSPAGTELCDTIDNNCDGEIDGDDASDVVEWYLDYDDDGYGADKITAWACEAPTYYVENVDDCDDLDPDISPGAEDVCGDMVDNNCDDSALSCSVTGSVDLSVADAKLVGNTTYTDSGRGIAIIGDVNGDGFDDIAVGAPSTSIKDGSTTGTINEGIVYVVHGPISGSLALDADADGSVSGEVAGDQAGYSVEAAGDIDGDGFADMLVGARDEGTGGTGAGATYLVSGPISAGQSLATAGVKLTGEGTTNVAGFVVGGVGDVDGDGVPDISTGAYGNSAVATESGAVYLIYGATATSGGLAGADAILLGEAANDRAGRWETSHGDVNGDGFADVVTGAYLADNAGTDAGRAYLNYGPLSGTTSLGDADAIFDGAAAGNQAGYVVDNAGDVNGDGYYDVLVSAVYEATVGTRNGAAYLIYGPSGSDLVLSAADATLLGVANGDHAGTRLSFAADMNGDGRDEIAVGAFGVDTGGSSAGAVYLVYGDPAGSISLSASDATFVGEAANDRAGNGIGANGDIDGDGYNDLLMGSLREATGGAYSGATYLVLGSGW